MAQQFVSKLWLAFPRDEVIGDGLIAVAKEKVGLCAYFPTELKKKEVCGIIEP